MNDSDRKMSDRERILRRRQALLTASFAASLSLTACDPYGNSCRAMRKILPTKGAKALGCPPAVCLSIARVPATGAPTASVAPSGSAAFDAGTDGAATATPSPSGSAGPPDGD